MRLPYKILMFSTSNFVLLFFLISSVNIGFCQSYPESIQKEEDSLLNVIMIAENDSLKVKKLRILSRKLYKFDYKKGFKYINQSIELAERIDYLEGKVEGHFLKGVIYYYTSSYDDSLEELFTALKLNDSLKADWLYATIYNYIGTNYLYLKSFEEARKYYEKSLLYYIMMEDKSGIAMLNNNLGLLLYDQGEYDSALTYFKKALLHFDDRINSITNTTLNIILVHLKRNKLDLARQKIEQVDSLKNKIDDFLILAEFYYIKGLYYRATKEQSKAINSFQKSIHLSKKKQFWNFVKLSSKELNLIYYDSENYKKSLLYYKDFINARDSLINIEAQKKILHLEIKNDQDKHLAGLKFRQQQKRIEYLFYLLITFCVCSLLGFLYYKLRKKTNLRKKEYEYKIKAFQNELQTSSDEKIQLKYELIYKRKELTFKNNELMNFALQIVQNDDFIMQIRQRIKNIVSRLKKEENLKMLEELDLFIRHSINLEKSKKEFYAKTKSLHEAFLYKLKEKFPKLSPKEIELALLLRLGYSSKEISTLLNISSKSVDMARYRFRKKINIDTNTSLTDFFNSLDNN